MRLDKSYLALIKGSGEGCDYTVGCNCRWEFLKAETKEDALKEVAEIVKYLVSDDLIDNIELIEYHHCTTHLAEEFCEKDKRIRGCDHSETDQNFCAKCGAPMWKENE